MNLKKKHNEKNRYIEYIKENINNKNNEIQIRENYRKETKFKNIREKLEEEHDKDLEEIDKEIISNIFINNKLIENNKNKKLYKDKIIEKSNNILLNFLDSQIINIEDKISDLNKKISPIIKNDIKEFEIIGDGAVQNLIEKTYIANVNTKMTESDYKFEGIINDIKHFNEHENSRKLVDGANKLINKNKNNHKQCITMSKRGKYSKVFN